jgi:hypothetical protein
MEHRWGERMTIDVPVKMRSAGSRSCIAGNLCDLSISGALVAIAAPLPLAARVEVELAGVGVPAWVVREEPGRVAVEWCELAPRAVLQLEQDARQFRHQWVA